VRFFAPALAVFACGLLAQCGGQAPATDASFTPVASVGQLMDAIVIPSSQKVFDAVVYSNGEIVASPRTDAEWLEIQLSALAVAEAGNLLLMPPRAIDQGAWATHARELNATAARAADAARRQDVAELLKAGGEMYDVCAACHAAYGPTDEP